MRSFAASVTSLPKLGPVADEWPGSFRSKVVGQRNAVIPNSDRGDVMCCLHSDDCVWHHGAEAVSDVASHALNA